MSDTIEFRVFAVLVDNEPGVLARVIGLFTGRGYNIDSLTVTEVDHNKGLSRINIVSSGTVQVLKQIEAQLDRLVPVHSVSAMKSGDGIVERETVLAKVVCKGEQRVEALRIADIYGAKAVDAGLGHFVFQLTHRSNRLERFINLLRPLGLTEVGRTGVVAMQRGVEGLRDD